LAPSARTRLALITVNFPNADIGSRDALQVEKI
jgi:hypothetical protein